MAWAYTIIRVYYHLSPSPGAIPSFICIIPLLTGKFVFFFAPAMDCVQYCTSERVAPHFFG